MSEDPRLKNLLNVSTPQAPRTEGEIVERRQSSARNDDEESDNAAVAEPVDFEIVPNHAPTVASPVRGDRITSKRTDMRADFEVTVSSIDGTIVASRVRDLFDALSAATISEESSNSLVYVEVDGHGKLQKLSLDISLVVPARLRAIESAIVETLRIAENRARVMEEELKADLLDELERSER